MENFKLLSEKTRSIIELSFSSFLFRLLKEPVYSLFCNKPSNILPEDCLQGKIIIINLPVKQFHKIGRDCQILFKYIWQRTMEKRNVGEHPRPVFLWADEAQNFIHEHDTDFQATARSSRIATVYITQNLPNYLSNMGGHRSESRVKSFLGTLATKIFHANADIDTNEYASKLFGERYSEDLSRSVGTAKDNISRTISYSLERVARPDVFPALATGGPNNNHVVEGYVHKQGWPLLANPKNYKIKFTQKN
ncbi:MAG: TraG/TraD/VirD4 family protein [Sphingobacteriales bacterium JAD_PAG50586_3]|nr:MAG: TraG/TraD/VirD4 family protein [Sphingobacteriales bacterium JAD_PAG50586_3]